MVVVAIIGILSAVAVPQFQKFQRKARQSEAKAMLPSIFTAQKAFRAETGSYYTNIWATGFEPEGMIRYNAGFMTAMGSDVGGYTGALYANTNYKVTWGICGTTWANGISQNCMYDMPTGAYPAGPATWTANSSEFLAGATTISGRFGIGGTSGDQWTINHRKELINTLNGAL